MNYVRLVSLTGWGTYVTNQVFKIVPTTFINLNLFSLYLRYFFSERDKGWNTRSSLVHLNLEVFRVTEGAPLSDGPLLRLYLFSFQFTSSLSPRPSTTVERLGTSVVRNFGLSRDTNLKHKLSCKGYLWNWSLETPVGVINEIKRTNVFILYVYISTWIILM